MVAAEALARWATGFRRDPLSPDVMHHAKRAVVDWHAALLAGLATPVVQRLERTLADDLDRGRARLALGRAATARAAALVNGTAAHAAEVDDGFREAMFHPGAATVAAALAAGQDAGAGGMQFLRAVVIGYEVSTRIGIVMGRPHYRFWHGTGTIGTLGAAAAAAAVLELDEGPFAQALATAATFAAGLQQSFRRASMSKPLHAGRAAEAGLLAAQLARHGITASTDVLDGEVGLGRAMGDGPDWSQIDVSLGQDFHIARVTFKPHAGCGHAFAAIDGALELQRRHGIPACDIDRVHIATYRCALEVAGHGRPTTPDEARFSVAYMTASALVHGSVDPAAFDASRQDDPVTRALLERISVSVDPELDAAFPEQRAARVEIVTRGGRRLAHLQAHRRGDPEQPLTDTELESKLLQLASPVIGADAAAALLSRLWSLDESDWL